MNERSIRVAILLLGALLWAGCGSSSPTGTGVDPSDDTEEVDDTTDPPEETCEPLDIPWLVAGNFWNVSWSWIEAEADWWTASSYGDFGVGSYTMKLGPPTTVEEKTMFPLQLSGQVDDFGPMWTHIGTDGCGHVYGMTSAAASPTLVFSEASDDWSGTGFWTDFSAESASVTVTRNASMTPSQYTQELPYFDPPLTRVGHSESESNYDPGGCEYFPGYGTICTEASTGPSSGTHRFEYWDPEAGPVGMHYARDYEDCLGVACTEEHVERRIEVWYFGDVTSDPLLFEDEPDTYADPTPFPVSEEIVVMTGAISEYDTPSGYIAGYDAGAAMELAAGIHDWFAVEVTPEMAGRTVDFYLAWNDPVDLRFHLFAAPDHAIGFTYLAEAEAFEWEEFEESRFFSGQFQEGSYLLGVERTTESDIETRYGVFGAMDPAGLMAQGQELELQRWR